MSDAGAKAKTQAPRVAAGPAVRSVVPAGAAPGLEGVPVLALQRSAGNGAVAGLVQTAMIHPALQRCSCASGAGKCARCQQDDEEVLRRSAVPGASPGPGVPDSVQSVLGTPGHPLDAGLRQEMEDHFGTPLDQVRVHTDRAAAESAAAVEARAYTVGQHIVFSGSGWAPHTGTGRHLLAHELAHTIQQRGARGGVQKLAIDPGGRDSAAEREADAAAHSLAAGSRPGPIRQTQPALRRWHMTKEPVGGCGICSKERLGPGWQKKVGQQAHGIVQAAALGLALGTSNALMQAEMPVTQKGGRKSPKVVPPITSKRDKDNGRLDLMVPTPTGFAIAEIKPSTAVGEEEGRKDLEYYERIIHQRYPDSTVTRLNLVFRGALPFPDTLAIAAGCAPQFITAMMMQQGLIGYFCTPPYSQARRRCSCRKKKDKKKEKKKDKKKDVKKSKKPAPKAKKPPVKKPAPRKLPRLKTPGAKGFSLSLGISLGGSSAGAANIGVGISVNSSGVSVGTAGATISYDSDGNAIGAVGASAARRSSANVAGGAGATAADQSSATGAGVASIGTAEKSDVTGAAVASRGSAENVTGTGVAVKTSGDAKDVEVKDAESGTAGSGKTEGKPSGHQGEKKGEESEAVEGAAWSEGDVRNSAEFKQAQASAKRIEAEFAKASPAQQKLMAELVKRYPEQVMPVPDERFVKKWINATAAVRDEHVERLASQPWAEGTDIDEAEFKRRVDAVIAGKTIAAEEASPSPKPPPEKKPPKATPPKDTKPPFKSVASLVKEAGGTTEDLRTQLQEKAKQYDYSNMDIFESSYDRDAKGAQTSLMYFRSPHGNAVALVVFTLMKRDRKDFIKILDASDAVTVEGKAFRPQFIGRELGISFR